MVKMKKCPTESTAVKLDRKTVERNRRIHMKGLCFKLTSLIPSHHSKHYSKEMLTQQDQLDLAASYITQLRERIEKLNARKEVMKSSLSSSSNNKSPSPTSNNDDVFGRMINGSSSSSSSRTLPVIELKDFGCSIEVILISGLQKNFMLYEVISVLQEEGADVISASFSVVEDKIFHTLHAQVKLSRVGVETSRVWQRLHDLMY